MTITEEYLLEVKGAAEEQRRKALDLVQQANGAIAMIDVMLGRLSLEDENPSDN